MNSGILPGVELTLNSSCLCSHTVKLGFADTLLLSCVAQERLETKSVVALMYVHCHNKKNASCLSTHMQRYLSIDLAVAVAAELWHWKLAGSPEPV